MAIGGRVSALLLLGLLPVMMRPELSTVLWWILLVALLVAADVVLAPAPRHLQIARRSSAPVRLGDATVTELTVTNPTSHTYRGMLRDAWQPSAGAEGERHTLSLRRGERVRLRTTLRPTRRGDRLADLVTVRVSGPLRLGARQGSYAVAGAVRALPPFTSRRHLPSRLAQLRQLDGRSAVRVRGQGTEFDSLRDWVDGDDVRSIDWRATARRLSVVVRTWQPERDRHIVLVIDTSRLSAARVDDMPRLDAAIDAALLLAALATRAGDRVSLVAGDRRVRARLVQPPRTTVLADLVTAMAGLEPAIVESDWDALVAAVAAVSRRRALVVLFTPLEPAAVEESLLPVLPMLTAHHTVVLASVADPEVVRLARRDGGSGLGTGTGYGSGTGYGAGSGSGSGDAWDARSAFDAAAAERTMQLRTRLARLLAQLGVHVVDADPGELPPQLADVYLQLKSRGRL